MTTFIRLCIHFKYNLKTIKFKQDIKLSGDEINDFLKLVSLEFDIAVIMNLFLKLN